LNINDLIGKWDRNLGISIRQFSMWTKIRRKVWAEFSTTIHWHAELWNTSVILDNFLSFTHIQPNTTFHYIRLIFQYMSNLLTSNLNCHHNNLTFKDGWNNLIMAPSTSTLGLSNTFSMMHHSDVLKTKMWSTP
jgi:hypothetical protein